MIKNYKQYNEGIKHLLVGPTEEEVYDNLNKLEPSKLIITSLELNYLDGVKKALNEFKHFNMDSILQITCNYGHIDIIKYLLDNYNFEMYVINNIIKLTTKEEVKELLNKYIDGNTNESIKHLLVGPTEEEVLVGLRKLKNRNVILRKSFEMDFEKGVILGLSGLTTLNNSELSDYNEEQLKKPKWFRLLMDMKIVPIYYSLSSMIKDNNFFILYELISNEFDINKINQICEFIPDLISKDNYEYIKLLLDNGVIPDCGDVLIAIDENKLSIVEILLDKTREKEWLLEYLFSKEEKDYLQKIRTKNIELYNILKEEYDKLSL